MQTTARAAPRRRAFAVGWALALVSLTWASTASAEVEAADAAMAKSAASDPMAAPACQAALAQLDEAEALQPPSLERLQTARRLAARRCLRERLDAPAPAAPAAAFVRPPMPPSLERLLLLQRQAGAPLPAPGSKQSTPLRPSAAPLVSVTQCDAGGCWASDGSRLLRLGPNLVGPRGVCSVQGTVLQCPP